MPVLPFCKSAYHRVPRQSKMDLQARRCHFLNFGYNHGSDCFKVMDAETGRIIHSHVVTWHQPQEPLISPTPSVGSGVPQSLSGAETPDYVHIQSAPNADLPTAPASNVPIPSTIAEAESWELAEIWRGSRTREFRGLLQANTFGPA